MLYLVLVMKLYINYSIKFSSLQYASLIDGLMVMMLTLKACLKELFLLVMYLLIAMFIFATSVSFLELQSEMGVGVPDCVYGECCLKPSASAAFMLYR